MAADPERAQALRAAGFAAVVDTEDPPGKTMVIFDSPDFDALIDLLIEGSPTGVLEARAQGYAEGREVAEATAARNARRALTVELVAAERAGRLAAKVAELARTHNVPTGDTKPETPGARDAMTGAGPSTGPSQKGRLRT